MMQVFKIASYVLALMVLAAGVVYVTGCDNFNRAHGGCHVDAEGNVVCRLTVPLNKE